MTKGKTTKIDGDTGSTEAARIAADPDYAEKQAAKVAEATGLDGGDGKIREGERAVKLKYDIDGGLGRHSEGTVIRSLSESAFMTLVNGGGHDVIEPGSTVGSDSVDASAPLRA